MAQILDYLHVLLQLVVGLVVGVLNAVSTSLTFTIVRRKRKVFLVAKQNDKYPLKYTLNIYSVTALCSFSRIN